MPSAPGSRCSDPECGEMAKRGGKCERHQRKAWENPSQHTLQMDRSQEYVWRKAVMVDPITNTTRMCAHCRTRVASVSDHIVPVGEGGARYDPANGQALCADCDAVKTRTDLARMAQRRRNARPSQRPPRG
jgi:5-methylcytosine-specific restriction protein A